MLQDNIYWIKQSDTTNMITCVVILLKVYYICKRYGGIFMWWKIVLIFVILAYIGGYWDDKYVQSRKRYKDRRKRRLYKFLMGLTYLITSGVSLLLIRIGGNVVFLYTIFAMIAAIGSFLSAINCNLRNLYSVILFFGTIIWVISFYYNNHKIIFSIIDFLLVILIIDSVKECITNIYHGIDPDLIEEEKEEKKKWIRRFKLLKSLIKIYF